MKSVFLGALLVLSTASCGGNLSDKAAQKIQQQAAFDLQCGKDQIAVTKISDDNSFGGVQNFTFGARGCGKQATYKASCAGWTGCSTMTDSQAKQLGQ